MRALFLPVKMAPFLLILVLCILLLRLPFSFVNFWTIDETGFAAVANKISTGHLLYKEACDNKPPFIFLLYAGIFLMFGQGNMYAVHLVTLLYVFLSLWLLYLLSAEMFSARIAKIAAILYTVYLIASPPGDVFASSTEVYLLPPVIAGIYLCTIGARRQSKWSWLGTGVLFGCAAWIKQPGVLFCLAVPVAALLGNYPRTRESFHAVLRKCFWAFLGFCVVSVSCLWMIYITGIFREFLDAVVFYNTRVQTASIPFRQSVQMALYTFTCYFKVYFIPILFAIAGLIVLVLGRLKPPPTPITTQTARIDHRNANIFLSWIAISIIAVSLGGRFYGYYMYILAPAVAILAALGIDYLRRCLALISPLSRWTVTVTILLGIVAPFYHFPDSYVEHLRHTIDIATRKKSTDELKLEPVLSTPALMVSKYAAENTQVGDRVFVWGYQPCIYVLSGRNFASRYFSVALQTGFVWGTIQQISGFYSEINLSSSDPAMKAASFTPADTAQWIYPGSQELLLNDLQYNPPEVFIDGNVPGEWPFSDKYPIAFFPKFQEFLNANYQLEKTILGYRIYRRLKGHPHTPETAGILCQDVSYAKS